MIMENNNKSFREELEAIEKERMGKVSQAEQEVINKIKNLVREDVKRYGMQVGGQPRHVKMRLSLNAKEALNIDPDRINSIMAPELNNFKITLVIQRRDLTLEGLLTGMMNALGYYELIISYNY